MVLQLDNDQGQRKPDDNEMGWRDPSVRPDDNLEDGFNQPAASDDDLPPNHPSRASNTPKELASAEGAADTGQSAAPQEETNAINSLYKPEPQKSGKGRGPRGFITRRRAVGGGIAGGIVGGLIAMSVFTSGPLQIIHFGQLLQSFHFGISNSITNDRTGSMYRYLRYPGNVEMRRMGVLGNKISARIDARFKSAGLTPHYEGGRLIHYRINPANLPALRSAGLGPDIKPGTGQFAGDSILPIDPDGTHASVARGRLNNLRDVVGALDVKVGAIGMRNLRVKAGVNFANLSARRIAQNIGAKRTAAKERKKSSLDTGKQTSIEIENKATDTDADGKTVTTVETDTASGGTEATRAKVEGAKNAAKGLAVVGLACAAYNIVGSAAELRESNVVMPLMRNGVRIMSIASQVMNGTVDVDEVGFLAEDLFDASAAPEARSWSSARSIQAEAGDELSGPDIASSAHPTRGGSAVLELFNDIPGVVGSAVDTVCGAVTGVFGIVAGYALDLATGGFIVGVITDTIIARMAGPVLEDVVSYLAGEQVPFDVKGAALGNFANYGALLAAGENMLSFGGRALSKIEVSELKEEQREQETIAFQRKSFAARLFDPQEKDSLVAKTVLGNPDLATPTQNVASLAKLPATALSSIGTLFRPFSGKANAQSTESYDYGIDEIGFSRQELDDPRYQNPFENEELIGPKLADYKDRIEECFGMNLREDGSLVPIANAVRVVNRGDNCNDTDEEFTRVRFYVLDMMTMESLACYEGEEESCQLLGFGSDTPVDSASPAGEARGEDTSAQACTIGQDAGIANTPVENIKIRLCNVSGITVNVAIEANAHAIITNGQAAGLTFTGGGYRSNAQQISTRVNNGCGGSRIYDRSCRGSPQTAVPGRSMHEWGLAIDLSCGGLIRSRATQCFRWLASNQSVHNLQNLPSEPWHWSSNGN